MCKKNVGTQIKGEAGGQIQVIVVEMARTVEIVAGR